MPRLELAVGSVSRERRFCTTLYGAFASQISRGQSKPRLMFSRINGPIYLHYRVFSHDVTAVTLVSQDNETAAMLVSQTNPVKVELFSYANLFFCSDKCWPRG